MIKEVSVEPVREDFIDSYNMHVVRQGMRQTVRVGSARSLSSLPVESAGKTGTAQWSSKSENHAWYAGFAPFDNPELAFAVLVEEGGEGSSIAVPIVKEYLEWYYRTLPLRHPESVRHSHVAAAQVRWWLGQVRSLPRTAPHPST